MNKKGQAQVVELFISAMMFILCGYIYFIVVAPITDNMLYPLLDNSTGIAPANAGVIKVLFQLIPLVVAMMGIIYLVTSLNKPREPQYPNY